MSKVSNKAAFSKNVLSFLRQAITRLKARSGEVRSVEVARSDRVHNVNSQPLGRRFSPRSLFSRQARLLGESAQRSNLESTGLTGKDGQQDGAQLLEVFRSGTRETFLRTAHDSAINPDVQHEEVTKYGGDLYVSFHEGLTKMTDKDVLKLYKKLNRRDMKELRAGLKLASEQDGLSLGVRKEFGFTLRHLEVLDRLILAEVSLRRSLVEDFPEPPRGERISKKTRNILARFGEELVPHISSSSGAVPASIAARFEEDFTKLAHEFEEGVPNKKAGKEGGICHLRRGDASSEELNVSEIYITDFARMPKRFDDGHRVVTNHELRWNFQNRKEISDHLTQFCGGDANQARRVSSLLSQQALAGLYKLQHSGELAPHPEIDQDQVGPIDGFNGNNYFSHTITRLENGDVRVGVSKLMEPSVFEQMSEDGPKALPIGGKKSLLRLDLDVLVPLKRSAPPKITEFRHSSHIVIEPPGHEFI